MRIHKSVPLFCLGGVSYLGLEILWRGRTHGSMFFAGGACFLLAGKLRHFSMPVRAVAGSAGITAVELVTGLLVNRDHHVWDYRPFPGNFRGQICLPFSLLWMPISLLACELYDLLECRMQSFCRGGS